MTAIDSIQQAKLSDGLCNYLKSLDLRFAEKRNIFCSILYNIYGDDLLTCDLTLSWLAKQLCVVKRIRIYNVVNNWLAALPETRGRNALPLETLQQIYDLWIEHSIPSTDGRNGRNMINLSKRKYIEQYGSQENKDIVMEQNTNKRGQLIYSSNRRIFTCTTNKLKEKLADKGVIVSIGKILSLKPFFITYASNKELALCLCKLCLNTRMLFDTLMVKAKKDGDQTTTSITDFFMNNSTCAKSENGYYTWKRVTQKCKDCKNCSSMLLSCKSNDKETTVGQFECTHTP